VRITASEFAASYLIWPRLSQVLADYPDITVELTVDYNRTDIVSERYDAGVRLGDEVAKDMIAVRISADQRIAVVGSPAYFAARSRPKNPADLAEHNCINLRLPTHGGLLPWDFQKGKKAGNGSTTARPRYCARRWPARGWASSPKPWRWSISPAGSWCGCWTTGASRTRATISTTRAGASPRARWRWWSRHCAMRSRHGVWASALQGPLPRHASRGGTGLWHC
jgi:DNA-binding transcriptional LysR family regulator